MSAGSQRERVVAGERRWLIPAVATCRHARQGIGAGRSRGCNLAYRRCVVGFRTVQGSAHVAGGRHRLRDELDPPAGRRRHASPGCATSTARCAWSGSGRASTPRACSPPRRSSAPGWRSPTTRCAAPQGRRAGADGRDVRHPRRRNRDDFFAMVRATLGVDAEVISGDEEARLSFVGAVGELDPDDGPFVVVDVGGGSTELVVGDLTTPGRSCAPPARWTSAACASPSAACPATRRPPSRSRRPRAVTGGDPGRRVRGGAGGGRAHLGRRRGHDHHAVRAGHGAAGLRPDAVHLSRLSLHDLHRVADELLAHVPRPSAPSTGRCTPGRIDVIGGGALIVDVLAGELHARAGITELVVSEHDILDGIALSLADLPAWRRSRTSGSWTRRSSSAGPAPGSSPGGSRWRGRSARRSATRSTGDGPCPASARPTPRC